MKKTAVVILRFGLASEKPSSTALEEGEEI
jgi:hypothetical protein